MYCKSVSLKVEAVSEWVMLFTLTLANTDSHCNRGGTFPVTEIVRTHQFTSNGSLEQSSVHIVLACKGSLPRLLINFQNFYRRGGIIESNVMLISAKLPFFSDLKSFKKCRHIKKYYAQRDFINYSSVSAHTHLKYSLFKLYVNYQM